MIQNIKQGLLKSKVIDECMYSIVDFISQKPVLRLSHLVEKIFACTSEDTFTLTKEYKLTALKSVKGKWPEQLGNGFFIESEYLFNDFLDMMRDSVFRYYADNDEVNELRGAVSDYIDHLKNTVNSQKILDEHVMQILGKMTERENTFVKWNAKKEQMFGVGSAKISEEISTFAYHLREKNLAVSSPMVSMMLKTMEMDFWFRTLFFTVTFFLFIIDSIVIYSMMMTDVEERTYEFAMLRTLGFKNNSLICLITV